MKKALIAVIATLFVSGAYAQTGGLPPEQAPAGNPGKLQLKKAPAATPAPAADAPAKAPMTKAEKKAARKAKREAKVGDKPLN